jgi:hypothetical protein
VTTVDSAPWTIGGIIDPTAVFALMTINFIAVAGAAARRFSERRPPRIAARSSGRTE